MQLLLDRFRRAGAVVALALAAILVVAGYNPALAGPDSILKVAFRAQNPGTLDPHRGSQGSDHVILWTIFDTLVTFDPATLEPRPSLAESWDWLDDRTLRLVLVEHAKFHDGTPVDAEAVKFNLDRIVEAGAGITISADLSAVESVEVEDARNVVLRLKRPSASLLLALADRAGMMVSPTALQADPEGFERHPIGSGPYTFETWVSGDKVTVRKNAGYWQAGEPRLAGIDFLLMADPETRLNALRSGEADLIYDVDPLALPLLESDSNIVVSVMNSLAYFNMFVDMSKAPLDDVRVRRAISMSIDREALVKAIQQGHGEAAWMPLPSDHWAYTPDLKGEPRYDPEAAKALLAEAGYADGFTLKMGFEIGSINERRAEILQSMLERIGVKLTLLPGETANVVKQYLDGEIDILNNRWTGRLDPAATYRGQFSINGFTNIGKFETPELTKAMEEGEASADIEDRKRAYNTVNTILVEETFNIPVFFQVGIVAHRNNVRGFVPNLLSKPRFEGVSID